jgi:DNA modification methylase
MGGCMIKPYYENEHGKLYCGDCLEIMPQLIAEGVKVDACITDPPYGCKKAEWDDEYPRWLVSSAFTISPLVCVMPGLWALHKCIADYGDRYKWLLIGDNMNGMTHGAIGYNNYIPAVVGGAVPVRGQDVVRFTIQPNEKNAHPSQKPYAFMTWLVGRLTDAGQTILDPFAGSGTTLVAAQSLGRKWIGIEISPEYCEIAKKRLEGTIRQIEGQVTLFDKGV